LETVKVTKEESLACIKLTVAPATG
jgi:hypothetical protein